MKPFFMEDIQSLSRHWNIITVLVTCITVVHAYCSFALSSRYS